MAAQDIQTLTRQDFVTDQDVRWCPGCGDYAILAKPKKYSQILVFQKRNF